MRFQVTFFLSTICILKQNLNSLLFFYLAADIEFLCVINKDEMITMAKSNNNHLLLLS